MHTHLVPPTDVIVSGSDRTRRRPSRRVVRAVAVLAVLVAGTIVSLRQYDENHARDLAAARAVRLMTTSDPTAAPNTVELRNVGVVSATILSVVVNRPGYAADDRMQALPAGGAVIVQVPYPTCGPTLITQPPDSIAVSLVAHGVNERKVIALSPDAFAGLDHALRVRCGYLPANEALLIQVRSVVRSGKQLIVHARLVDNSLLPLTFDRVIPFAGVAISTSPPTPIVLPVQTAARQTARGRDVVVTITVRSCTDLGLTSNIAVVWLERDASLYEIPLALPEGQRLARMCG